MAVVDADIVFYASANMPDADTGTNGGAIDPLRRVEWTKLAANDDIEVISSAAGDTQNCTIEGRNAAGQVVSETAALTGTTAKIFSNLGVIQRVLKVELASGAVGTVTVRRSVAGATVGVIPVGERGFLALFRKAAAEAAGGAQRDYYSKIFAKNTHATLALTSVTVKQNADPDARVTHLPAAANDDSASAADRRTAPGASDTLDPDTFDDTDKAVSDLGAGVARGIWLRLRLPAGDPAHDTTYTIEVAGTST